MPERDRQRGPQQCGAKGSTRLNEHPAVSSDSTSFNSVSYSLTRPRTRVVTVGVLAQASVSHSTPWEDYQTWFNQLIDGTAAERRLCFPRSPVLRGHGGLAAPPQRGRGVARYTACHGAALPGNIHNLVRVILVGYTAYKEFSVESACQVVLFPELTQFHVSPGPLSQVLY